MTALDRLLEELHRRDVRIWAEGSSLKYDAPGGVLSEAIIDALRTHKATLLDRIAATAPPGPIAKAGGGPYPLSFAQERMWFLWCRAPSSPVYHVPVAVALRGPLDLGALLDSVRALAERHEVLRSRYVGGADGPRQIVEPPGELDLRVLEPEGALLADRVAAVRRHVAEEAMRPFDLERAAPLIVRVYRVADTEHHVLLKLHHIAVDASSISLLLDELAALYAAHAQHAPCALPAPRIAYHDFAAWQRDRLTGAYREQLVRYWRDRLAIDLPRLRLPGHRSAPAAATPAGAKVSFQLRAETTAALRALAHAQQATLFMILVGAFRVLLYRYTEQADVPIGAPVVYRNHRDLAGVVGYFGNTLVLRNPLSPRDRFADVIARERAGALAAYDHQELPFDVLVRELVPGHRYERHPLFQVACSFTGAGPEGAWPSGIVAEVTEVDTATAKFELLLAMAETGDDVTGVLEYSTDALADDAAARMAEHFAVLVEDLARRPDVNIREATLLRTDERTTLLDTWNATGRDEPEPCCIHELFQQAVAADPDAIAIRHGTTALTYDTLDRAANRWSHRLIELGLGRGDLVAICAPRSPRLVAALLSILKAGAAYVPIDPRYPRERIALLLAESGAAALMTEREVVPSLPAAPPPLVLLDDDAGTSEDAPTPVRRARPEDLAYVLYTSGSTGSPKGVMIEHRNTTAFLRWAYTVYDREDLACVLAGTSICFDLSVFELFAPLCAGHCVVLAENVMELPSLPTHSAITLVNTVPSAMRALLQAHADRLPAGLRVVNLAGERLDPALVDLVYQRTRALRVYDLYGPTEATTYSTYKLRIFGQPASIGRPISRTRCYVLDPYGAPVPIGVVGELCLAGAGLARGYLHREDLTAQRFAPSPWIDEARLYRTGDLVRYDEAGELEYVCRNDDQLKIRGHRLEPAEIRAALVTAVGIDDAVVVARPGPSGDHMLVAYVVCAADAPDDDGLRRHVRRVLPEHAIPSRFVRVAALPLNDNGKLDVSRLPDPGRIERADRARVALEPGTQHLIADIWRELLGLAPESADDDFFALGGHSLIAMQVTARIDDALGIDLPLELLFEHPTVAELAAAIDTYRERGRAPALPSVRWTGRDRGPATLLQRQLWLLHRVVRDPSFLNIATSLYLSGPLDREAAITAMRALGERHPILRSRFVVNGGLDCVPSEVPLPVQCEDLDGPGVEDQDRALTALYQQLTRPFELDASCARFAIVRLAHDHHVIIMVFHHSIIDEWSIGVLRRELATCYAAALHGQPIARAAATFADLAAWEHECLEAGLFEPLLARWQETLRPPLPALEFPWPRAARVRCHAVELDPQRTNALAAVARRASTSLFVTLLSALTRLCQQLTGETDIRIVTNLAARHRRGSEHVVGPLTDTIVLRTRLPADHTPASALELARAGFVAACSRQGAPFDALARRLADSNIPRSALAQVFFHFDEGRPEPVAFPGLTVEDEPPASEAAFFEHAVHGYDLILYLGRAGDAIRGQLAIASADAAAGEAARRHLLRLVDELA